MGWARVMPSSRLLLLILLTTTVTVCVCVASCVVLWLAPQVPYSEIYNGGSYVHYPALVLAAAALVAALSLFPGSCGLWRDSKAALITYCVMLLAVTAAELAGSGTVFTFTYIGKVESNIGQHLWKDLNTFESNDSNSSHTHRINSLQSEYHCCGVDSYRDWNKTEWSRREAGDKEKAPQACCKSEYVDTANCSTNSSRIYDTGCVDVLMWRTEIAVDSALGVCVFAALLNLVVAGLICRAVYHIRRYQNYSVI